jgi:signal transduction histidine kinase
MERAESRLRVLAQASHAFASVVTDRRRLLDVIARTAADLVGDGCAVFLLAPDGESLHMVSSAHRDRLLEVANRTYMAGTPILVSSSTTHTASVVRTGTAVLVPIIDPRELAAGADAVLKPIIEQININSLCVVPIRARGTVIGCMTLLRSQAGQPYSEDDQTLLEDLADRAGLAVDNSRLYGELERRVRERTDNIESLAHVIDRALRAQVIELEAKATDPEAVRASARQITRIIDGVLQLVQLTTDELKPERLDLADIARAATAKLRTATPERKVDVTVADRLLAVVDRRLIEIAIANLLANAWERTRDVAQARIEVGAHPGQHPKTFFVRDNGPAIAANAAVFAPFADDGIGLASAARIVRRHGGRIWVEGTTFNFVIDPESR